MNQTIVIAFRIRRYIDKFSFKHPTVKTGNQTIIFTKQQLMVRSPVKSTSSRSPCRVEFECRGAEQLLLSNQKPTLTRWS